MKISLITGINGQDGSYLAELLLQKDYLVYGLVRKSSSITTQKIDHIYNNKNLVLKYGDLLDLGSLVDILTEIKQIKPSVLEIYNLAAQSHVKVSFDMPIFTSQIDAIGPLNLLEAIRKCNMEKISKFYQASTSELYGDVLETPQNEDTPFNPQSPYACAKLYAFWITKNYRKAYDIFTCNGILFNHESSRRGSTFVTKKITKGVAKIFKNKQEFIELGNLDAKRDWGHAKDYVLAMWKMMQLETPEDLVISSNNCISVREFVEKTFKNIGIVIKWKGSGVDEVGYEENNQSRILVKINPRYFRPAEVKLLKGDSMKARKLLDWEPTFNIDTLISEMLEYDLKTV